MKTRFIAAAVVATLGLGSVSAFAQDYHRHDRGTQQNWQQRDHRVDSGSREWANNQRYNNQRYYAPSYAYRNNGYDNGDLVGAAVIGALAGAVLGSATNNYNYAPGYYQQPSYGTYYNPGYGYYNPGNPYGY